MAGALARATRTRLNMGVQFEADSSTLARAEARAMLGRRPPAAAAFELGNEPSGSKTLLVHAGWATGAGAPSGVRRQRIRQ